MKRISLSKAECPVARSLDLVGDWWSLLIVRDAFDGVRRFGAFQESLGIARGILTTRLRGLVEGGVLEITPAADGSAYHDYVLTEKGRGLFTVVVALRQWGEDFLYKSAEKHSTLIEKRTGKAVGRLELQREGKGAPLTWDETEVRKLLPQEGRGRKS